MNTATITNEIKSNVGRDLCLAFELAEQEAEDAGEAPTLRDRAMKLSARHFLHDVAGRDWFTVSDGDSSWTVRAYWHGGDVVAVGGDEAARLAVVMSERARVAQAQGF